MRALWLIIGVALPAPLAAVEWSPFVEPYQQIFPSLEIATATMDSAPSAASVIGDADGLIGVQIEGARAGSRFDLIVRIPGLARDSHLQGLIPKVDAPVTLVPSLNWDFQTLAKIQQPRPAIVEFELKLDGVSLGSRSERVRVRSINDALYFIDEDGDTADLDFNWLFAAYVNEDDPAVDRILKEALDSETVDGFTGYQLNDPDEVLKQVFAIWHVLQQRGIRYSSIARTGSEHGRVLSQHVRFVGESLTMTQANCVDGSVLLASVLRKIDLDPELILTPGHMFLGIALDARGQEMAYLETTLLGKQVTSGNQGARLAKKDLASEAVDRSFASFSAALSEGKRQMDAAGSAFDRRDDAQHQIIDIEAARKLGVMPIGR